MFENFHLSRDKNEVRLSDRADRAQSNGSTMRSLASFHIELGQFCCLLSDAVCLRIFIYNGTKTKLGSVCRADQIQSNGPTLRSLANFHIELEQFCGSLTAAKACI